MGQVQKVFSSAHLCRAGSGTDITILMPVGFGPVSVTALSDAGRARTEKCGSIDALIPT